LFFEKEEETRMEIEEEDETVLTREKLVKVCFGLNGSVISHVLK
jgi:hypothetical protein